MSGIAFESCTPSDVGTQRLPTPSASATRRAAMSWLATTLILINVGFAALYVLATRRFGSLAPTLAYLRGDVLIPDAYAFQARVDLKMQA